MGLIFDVYTDDVYKEIHLPSIDNADYTLVLSAEQYDLSADIRLFMEVIDGKWLLKSSTEQVMYAGRMVSNLSLDDGQILQLTKCGIAILIRHADKQMQAFQKYVIDSDATIMIGKDPNLDISCPELKALSLLHAEIRYENGAGRLVDKSRNGIYLGSYRVRKSVELKFGDVLNMYGLTIVYLGFTLAVYCTSGIRVNSNQLVPLEFKIEDRTMANLSGQGKDMTVHISPRVIHKLNDGVEVIENAPQKKEGDKKPFWMSVLPSVTMVLPMILGYSMMGNGAMGMGLTISIGSALVGFIWANVNLRYARNTQKEQEMERLRRYSEYLIQCADRIREKFQYNRNALLEMYPSAQECCQYNENSSGLWTRKMSHSDFLFTRLGLGDMPFQVQINTPEVKFSMVDDELAERPRKIAENFRIMRDVPLGINLDEFGVVGLLYGDQKQRGIQLAQTMIAQVASSNSYTDVKIGILSVKENEDEDTWDELRWCPHIWNEDRTCRYIATSQSGINEILYELTQVLRKRTEKLNESHSMKRTTFSPHYLLIVDDPSILEGQLITKYLYESGRALGITTIIMAHNYEELPSACGVVVEKSEEFSGFYEVKEGGAERREVEFDTIEQDELARLMRNLSRLKVGENERSSDIPDSLTFFQMRNVKHLEELAVQDHWKKNRTFETMRAVIGQKAGGTDCYLDINEKYHGPHGLLAGTTGSGKSETLQTYILSLAVNFSPLDVGFFLIDFKGGGMANLFTGLPHIMGQISNLSGNQVRRAMVSIKSENTRREKIFHDFGVKNIDQYTKLVKNKDATIPMPHLLIIIDEFAELKKEEPEFMQELISVAAVGRSLGVHLILATQKPGNCVDDNIRSNSKFRLCLRVQTKEDSRDMLGKPDAAYLTQAGRCYLQVGSDEIYELFQSGWSGAPYQPTGEDNSDKAVLIDEQGKEIRFTSKQKNAKKEENLKTWIKKVLQSLRNACDTLEILPSSAVNREGEMAELTREAMKLLNSGGMTFQIYTDSPANKQRLEDVVCLLEDDFRPNDELATKVIAMFRMENKKLPEREEITQLDAVVDYLAKVAKQTGMENTQRLWMPELPRMLYLDKLEGYQENAVSQGKWKQHDKFSLAVPIGLIDMPAQQMQFPLMLDLSKNGHLIVAGGATSGKSTMIQSIFYALIHYYSPSEVNLYAIDFSSQMLCPFEHDAHVGGIVLEGEDDRIDKLFGMLASILAERKKQLRGGSFSQYIQQNGNVMPAVVFAIDGYASFQEKTNNRHEHILTELTRDAENYGIYIIISCNGFGTSQLQRGIARNMRQRICLELGEGYSEIMNVGHIDIYPEENTKGRGIVSHEGTILEYQTALSCVADNDYQRSEIIRAHCERLSKQWMGKKARKIPEIPENPVWENYSKTDEYLSMLKEKRYLPVAYYQENASLYGIDLSKTFCYLILGSSRSGKSTFLRNIACAAKDYGGKVVYLDGAEELEKKSAQFVGVDYISDENGRFQMTKEIILATNERNIRKKSLMDEGMDEEEIFQVMSKEFQPIFYMIGDLKGYMDALYSDSRKTYNHIEKIILKARLMNVYFFAALDESQLMLASGRMLYLNFIQDRQGVVLGKELNKQNLFSYQNIKYSEQGKRFKAGRAYAVSQEEPQNVDLIVIPNNKVIIAR